MIRSTSQPCARQTQRSETVAQIRRQKPRGFGSSGTLASAPSSERAERRLQRGREAHEQHGAERSGDHDRRDREDSVTDHPVTSSENQTGASTSALSWNASPRALPAR